ncbi:MAG TPA: protein phosphatase 2C domain-containing protein [Patescibacteria group bacterium]|nr:protein phosphatase 2C domain-containing protein [Patescibacteria group bacterium]
MNPAAKSQKGVIDPLSLFGVLFLVVSLFSIVFATSNPAQKWLIDSLAGGRVRNCSDLGSPQARRDCENELKDTGDIERSIAVGQGKEIPGTSTYDPCGVLGDPDARQSCRTGVGAEDFEGKRSFDAARAEQIAIDEAEVERQKTACTAAGGTWTEGQCLVPAPVVEPVLAPQPIPLTPAQQEDLAVLRNNCLQEGGSWLNNQCSYQQQQEAIAQFGGVIEAMREESYVETISKFLNDSADGTLSDQSLATNVQEICVTKNGPAQICTTNNLETYATNYINNLNNQYLTQVTKQAEEINLPPPPPLVPDTATLLSPTIFKPISPELASVLPEPDDWDNPYVPNYGKCAFYDNECNQLMQTYQNLFYNVPIMGQYLQAYNPENVTYHWQELGYDSYDSCMKDQGFALGVGKCGGYTPTKEQITSSISLGTTATVLSSIVLETLPGTVSVAAKAAAAHAGIVQTAATAGVKLIVGVGGASTVLQTSNAAIAWVDDPFSKQAITQTGLAVLSWTNLATADRLISSFSSGVQSAMNQAAVYNTAVSGINLVVDGGYTIVECRKEGASLSPFAPCGGSALAMVADIGFGFLDFKQNQLVFGTGQIDRLLHPSRTATDLINQPRVDAPVPRTEATGPRTEVTAPRAEEVTTPKVEGTEQVTPSTARRPLGVTENLGEGTTTVTLASGETIPLDEFLARNEPPIPKDSSPLSALNEPQTQPRTPAEDLTAQLVPGKSLPDVADPAAQADVGGVSISQAPDGTVSVATVAEGEPDLTQILAPYRPASEAQSVAKVQPSNIEGPYVDLAKVSNQTGTEVLDIDPLRLGSLGLRESFEAQGVDNNETYLRVISLSDRFGAWLKANTADGDVLRTKDGNLFIRRNGTYWEQINPDGTLNYKHRVQEEGLDNFELSGGTIIAKGTTINMAPLSEARKQVILQEIVDTAPNDGVSVGSFVYNLRSKGFTDDAEIVRLYEEVNQRIAQRPGAVPAQKPQEPPVANPPAEAPEAQVPPWTAAALRARSTVQTATERVNVFLDNRFPLRRTNEAVAELIGSEGGKRTLYQKIISLSGGLESQPTVADSAVKLRSTVVGIVEQTFPSLPAAQKEAISNSLFDQLQLGSAYEVLTITQPTVTTGGSKTYAYQSYGHDVGQDSAATWDSAALTQTRGVDSVALVADGHGDGGEIASQIARDSFLKYFRTSPNKDPRRAMEYAFDQLERLITSQLPRGGGTTLTAAVQVGDQLYIGHVGDSLLFLIDGETGAIRKLTTDHNWPNGERRYLVLVSRTLGDAEIKVASQGVLTAIPDILNPVRIKPGDQIIIGSDSLERLSEILGGQAQLESTLVNAAKGKPAGEAAETIANIAQNNRVQDDIGISVLNIDSLGGKPKGDLTRVPPVATNKLSPTALWIQDGITKIVDGIDAILPTQNQIPQIGARITEFWNSRIAPLLPPSLSEQGGAVNLTTTAEGVAGRIEKSRPGLVGQVQNWYFTKVVGDTGAPSVTTVANQSPIQLGELHPGSVPPGRGLGEFSEYYDLPDENGIRLWPSKDGSALVIENWNPYNILSAGGNYLAGGPRLLSGADGKTEFRVNGKTISFSYDTTTGTPKLMLVETAKSVNFTPRADSPLAGAEIRSNPDGTVEIKTNLTTSSSGNRFIPIVDSETIPGIDGRIIKAKGNYYHILDYPGNFKATPLTHIEKEPNIVERIVNFVQDSRAASKAKANLLAANQQVLGSEANIARVLIENGYNPEDINGRRLSRFIASYNDALVLINNPTYNKVYLWITRTSAVLTGGIVGSAAYIGRDIITTEIYQATERGYYSPLLNTRIIYRDGKWYRLDNGEEVNQESGIIYLDGRFVRQSELQYVLIDQSTFQSHEWLKFEQRIANLTADDPYNIDYITSAIFATLTYNDNWNENWDLHPFVDKDLQNLLAKNITVCYEFAIAEQAYLATLGIKSDIAVSGVGEVDEFGNQDGHAFLIITDGGGRKWVADPTNNIVVPYEEYVQGYNVTGLGLLPSIFKSTNPENTVDFTIGLDNLNVNTTQDPSTEGQDSSPEQPASPQAPVQEPAVQAPPIFLFYSQKDPTWADIPTSSNASTYYQGCGIFTGAMVTGTDPYTYWESFNNYFGQSRLVSTGGTSFYDHKSVLESMGYELAPLGGSTQDIKDQISNYAASGIPVWVNAEILTGSNWIGHHTMATGVDADGNIIFNDPFYGANVSIPDSRIDEGTDDGDESWKVYAVIPPGN